MATNVPATPDTLIGVKVSIQGSNRKFKIPLRELTPQVLPGKLRSLLEIPENQTVVFERYSDSAAAYVTLDASNTQVYKTLFRAAKAKGKLRLRATVNGDSFPNLLPSLNQLGMPAKMAFASNFPEFVRFGSETTLASTATATTAAPSTVRTAPSVETLTTPSSANLLGEDGQWSAACGNPTRRSPTRLTRESYFNELANIARQREMAFRTKQPQAPMPAVCSSWSVYCNNCDQPMENEHYHCNVCDDGDYDLCEGCVNKGVHCPGESHWLIKRFVENGNVINSTTETLVSKSKASPPPPKPEMPGAFTDEKKVDEEEYEGEEPSRTCNSCVKEFPDRNFVTCLNCEDFDLCLPCHEGNKHGHHPGHAFEPTTGNTPLNPAAEFLCAPGRNVKHAALCDGCDKPIFGVRHKCLYCPDWDYCSECFKNASFIHPLHRFAPIFDPISMPRQYNARHVGIYCDGPLCQNKHDYIQGVRYKCAICHDTDFCGNCESYPHNKHNRTHPMIMFKTAVRGVGITTMVEDKTGASLGPMGDRTVQKPVPQSTASEVQTIVDVKPTEVPATPTKVKVEKIEIKDLLAEPIQEMSAMPDLLPAQVDETVRVPLLSKAPAAPVDVNQLRASFVRETVPDSTVMQKDQTFVQVWTLRNPGPVAWPAGCSVRYTGGDNMLNVDKKHPASTREVTAATETNTVARPVEIGEEIAFRVALKAPQSVGTKISYWRLKTADGQAFGHRLWCHIVVSEATRSEPSSLPQPISPRFAPVSVPTVERTEEVGRPAHQDFLRTVLQQRVDRRRELGERAKQLSKALEDARTLRETQKKAEEEQKATRAQMLRNLSSEIHAVEVQYKARSGAAKAAMEAAKAAKEASPAQVSELPAAAPTSESPMPNHALTGCQIQLMLLEQANKKRILMARQEREAQAPVAEAHTVPKELAAESSRMIFPTLEKESPASSTHDLPAPAAPAIARSASVSTQSANGSEADIFEDAESVDLMDSSDDGFLTDEEYDILDASDEEFA
jgi:next-to-BRCA1 protein 1